MNSQEKNWWTAPSGQTQPQTTRPRKTVDEDGHRGPDERGEDGPRGDRRDDGEERVEMEEGLDVSDIILRP